MKKIIKDIAEGKTPIQKSVDILDAPTISNAIKRRTNSELNSFDSDRSQESKTQQEDLELLAKLLDPKRIKYESKDFDSGYDFLVAINPNLTEKNKQYIRDVESSINATKPYK